VEIVRQLLKWEKQKIPYCRLGFGFMVFNATFNNISVISWWSVLLVEETGEYRENHTVGAIPNSNIKNRRKRQYRYP